jgi:hypothetical protein
MGPSPQLHLLLPNRELDLTKPQYIISCYPDPGYDPVPQEGEAHVVYYVHTQPAGGYGTVQPNGQFPGQQAGTANAFKPKPKTNRSSRPQPPPPNVPAPTPAPADNATGEGSSRNPDLPPPTYTEAVKGDNKIQD